MARIAGVNVPENKHLEIALTHIYGIGKKTAQDICLSVKLDYSKKVSDLSEEQIETIRTAVANYTVEGDLRRSVSTNIKDLWTLDVTEELGIEENCQFMVKELKPMQGLERVQKNQ